MHYCNSYISFAAINMKPSSFFLSSSAIAAIAIFAYPVKAMNLAVRRYYKMSRVIISVRTAKTEGPYQFIMISIISHKRLTHLCSSISTQLILRRLSLEMSISNLRGCLVWRKYYRLLQKFLCLMKTVYNLIRRRVLHKISSRISS